MDEKTNVMRWLDQKKAVYTPHDYPSSGAISAQEVARALGQDPARVFKTLVTTAGPRKYYVFVVPAVAELNLKKAAAAAGEKSVSMLAAKELLPLTGYVHGGCSPIGMKKAFPTFVDTSAQALPTICFSAGKIGRQVEMEPAALAALIGCRFAPLV
ncbi:MAG: Cys-tRNA(Pro) deacylase [Eubacteriales bacterium]|nr:Cys-tRNA(Pro) deacylase [Eubacteriales bacterium]